MVVARLNVSYYLVEDSIVARLNVSCLVGLYGLASLAGERSEPHWYLVIGVHEITIPDV